MKTENKTIEAEIEKLGNEMFFSNEHSCPDCGRGAIGDKPIKIKHLWVFSKFKELLDLALKERTESLIEDFKNRDFEVCKLHTISKYDPSIECKNCLANLKSKYLKQEEKA